MRRRDIQVFGVLLVGVFLSGCGYMPSETNVYALAVKSVQADASFPAGAKILAIDDTPIHVSKSAARVDVRYSHPSTGEQTMVVWLKRICLRWELDRLYPKPTY